ncbi:Phage portal protein [Pseudovibrio axinellae]|uniref:Phage portal protein n=1 Tax=Pseudovibrio axinellae TaxID=989403 RepID=A0A165SW23_9HYPH|nr:phage portal protein [Pseudovibrio axinellae]KZL04550.1 Phage portal protein [Pseudovibrio axinellae]SEQ73416.1 phage portal protein, HK97 family [Pseudovibrio axinellae]
MIRIFKAAIRGIRQELQSGESGWINLNGGDAWSGGGHSSAAGKTVNASSALAFSAVWDCVRKTSQVISTLPLALYEKRTAGSRVKIEEDLTEILCASPNREQTAVEFWEGMTAHMTLRGNAFAERLFIGPNLVGLRPLLNVTPRRNQNNGLEYEVTDRGKLSKMPADKVFHMRGFGAGDGLGMSAIKYGANSIGAALAADETAGSVFSNAMMAAGVLTSDQSLNANQRSQLQTLLETFIGSRRAGKTLTLESGLKFQQLQLNPEDAQLLETRRFSVEDVCRWFGVPPIVIGHSADGQTMWGSGVEAVMLSWLSLGINPLLVKNEARILKDLIPVEKRGRWYVEYNREAMLQMDSKAKGDFLLKMRMGGFMSGDEGRDKLNLPRRGGNSDELVVQTSMGLVDLLGKEDK